MILNSSQYLAFHTHTSTTSALARARATRIRLGFFHRWPVHSTGPNLSRGASHWGITKKNSWNKPFIFKPLLGVVVEHLSKKGKRGSAFFSHLHSNLLRRIQSFYGFQHAAGRLGDFIDVHGKLQVCTVCFIASYRRNKGIKQLTTYPAAQCILYLPAKLGRTCFFMSYRETRQPPHWVFSLF